MFDWFNACLFNSMMFGSMLAGSMMLGSTLAGSLMFGSTLVVSMMFVVSTMVGSMVVGLMAAGVIHRCSYGSLMTTLFTGSLHTLFGMRPVIPHRLARSFGTIVTIGSSSTSAASWVSSSEVGVVRARLDVTLVRVSPNMRTN